jgi:hypothetical protein
MSDSEDGLDMFEDPADYYPPTPPPTSQTYTTASGTVITLHLVGHSPLEAHHLWYVLSQPLRPPLFIMLWEAEQDTNQPLLNAS